MNKPTRTERSNRQRINGWRYWVAGEGDDDVVGLVSPFQRRYTLDDGTVVTKPSDADSVILGYEDPEWPGQPGFLAPDGRLARAICWDRDHKAPARDCGCGHRIVEQLDDLTAWMLMRAEYDEMPNKDGSVRVRRLSHHVAIVKVHSFGSVLPWQRPEEYDHEDDPPGTWKCEGMVIDGPMILSPDAAHLATKFSRTFNMPVTAGKGTFTDWLRELSGGKIAVPRLADRSPYLRSEATSR